MPPRLAIERETVCVCVCVCMCERETVCHIKPISLLHKIIIIIICIIINYIFVYSSHMSGTFTLTGVMRVTVTSCLDRK